MKVAQPSLQRAAQVALVAMLVLLAGALYYFKERMLFIDAAHICFRIINLKTLVIEEHRYGSFITQMVPLIGLRLHLSLRTILIAYSISFNLFYFGVMLLLVYRYRQYSLAILMALYYTLFVSDVYFWTNNEVHQGTAWMFLFFALFFHLAHARRGLWLQLPVFAVLAALAIFTHPLIMISILFLWGYFFINRDNWSYSNAATIGYSVLLLVIVAAKFYISQQAGYDSGKMDEAMHTKLRIILQALHNPMVKTFIHDCFVNYWLFIIIWLVGLYTLIRQGRWWLLAYTLAAFTAYFILMSLTYPGAYDRHTLFYMESEWMSLSIIAAAPFVFNFLPGLKEESVAWSLSFIFLIRLLYIGNAAPAFSNRLAFVEQGLAEMRNKKLSKVVLLKENNYIEDKLLMGWGLPDESLMASVLDGDKPALTYTEMSKEQIMNGLPKDNKTMIASFQLVGDMLNRDYFPIDTTRPYEVLTYDAFMK